MQSEENRHCILAYDTSLRQRWR